MLDRCAVIEINMKQVLFMMCLLLLTSCLEKQKAPLVINFEFLKGKWRMDSIVGSNKEREDWVYFTDDSKYWRFSLYNKSYLVEGDLRWEKDKIYKSGDLTYLVEAIDSNHILINDGQTKYHCVRFMMYPYYRDINNFLNANPFKELINGWWTLDTTSFQPRGFGSYGSELIEGSDFHFTDDGKLEIFNNFTSKSNNSINMTYWIHAVPESPTIAFVEKNTEMAYNIIMLDSSNLILKSVWLEGTNIHLSRKKS
jgi:hypothetical protein